MALKAHLFGWTIIQKGLTNTQSLSKFISMLLLIVHLLKLSTESVGILRSCKLEKGHSPDPLRIFGAFLGHFTAKPCQRQPQPHAAVSPTFKGLWDTILIVLEEEAKKNQHQQDLREY